MSNKEKVTTEQTEPYQRKMKAKNRRMKVRLIGKGEAPKAAPYNINPSMDRSKSAPPLGEDAQDIIRECIREVYKENGIILTEEQLDEALPRWMQKAGAYAGVAAALAGGVPSTAAADTADTGDSGIQVVQQERSAAEDQRDFYKKYINVGTQSPFYENAEGFGLGYEVSRSDARNYLLSFKLDGDGNPIPDSYQAIANVGEGQDENADLTDAHQRSLQEIAESIEWATEYPAIVAHASGYSATKIGPLEWRGQVQISGRDVSF